EALAAFPRSADLWWYRGNLIQTIDGREDLTVEDALECYRTALRYDPHWGEPYCEIGYWYDVFRDDYVLAEENFRRAIARGGGTDPSTGLPRGLTEKAGKEEAIQPLADGCRREESAVTEMRGEIVEGTGDPHPDP